MANGFIFGGETGLSHSDLQRRRALVQALAQQQAGRGAPRNVGEGLSALGSAIAYRRALSDLGRQEAAGRRSAQEAFAPVLSALTGQTSGAGTANIFGETSGVPEMEAYIRESASARGIDPDVAVRVARSEGLAPGVWQSNFSRGGVREPSFGPFQLLVGGEGTGYPTGLGNTFIEQTGLDPRDPTTWKAQVDFALDQAAQGGWSPWYGAAKVGIGDREGIGQRPAGAPPAGNVNIFGEPQATPAIAGGAGLQSPELINALLGAAQNQFLGPGQQQIVGTLLNRALTPQKPPDPVTLGTGDVLVDPRTDRQIAAGTPTAPKPPTVTEIFTEGGGRQKVIYNPQTGQFDPVGEAAPPRAGTALSVNPETGEVQFTQGGVAQDGIPVGKPPTEMESKTIVYATRAAGALPIVDKYDEALTSYLQTATELDPTGLARMAQSPEFQQARQAGLEFLQAILRKDTGAAITRQEQEEYGKTYLPQPGDTTEVIQQKREARARALEAMERGLFGKELLLLERNQRLQQEREEDRALDLSREQEEMLQRIPTMTEGDLARMQRMFERGELSLPVQRALLEHLKKMRGQ